MGRVGFLDSRVADGLGIELALDHDETGGSGDEEIGAEVARAPDATDGVTGGGEEIADEVFVVRAGRDRREIGAAFEGGASERGRGVGGAAIAVGGAPFRRGRRAAGALGFTVNHRRRIW